MKDARVLLVPCRPNMPLTEKIRSGLEGQFPGLVKEVPAPAVPESLSAVENPPGEESQRGWSASVVLVDLTGLKTRPGFIRVLLGPSLPENTIVVAENHACEYLLRQLLPERAGPQVVCADHPHGIASILLQHLGHSTHQAARSGLREECGLRGIVGESQFIRELKQRLPSIAGSDSSVLITGETGTGKEVVARAIHYLSKRRHKAFVPLHCGAIPSDLFENELFGHRRGAYTGAEGSHEGLIAQADRGTLFLDEISTLPMRDQEKLLRVLQEGEYRPLGGVGVVRADIRILAATNVDLEAAVQRGRFRIDLLYRINTLVIEIPPLRSRPEDVLPLAHHFLRLYCGIYRKESTGFSTAAIAWLEGYGWPGNVRELQHVVESAVALTENPEIVEVELHPSKSQIMTEFLQYRVAKRQAEERFQREYLTRLVQAAGGNLSRAARMAGVERGYFFRLLRRHCICVNKGR